MKKAAAQASLCVIKAQKVGEYKERPCQHLLGINTYLEDVPPLEAQLVVCSGFEVIFGDGFHSERCSVLSSLKQGEGSLPC